MDRALTLAVVQARMSSTRLPGKSMLTAGGTPLIGILLERLKRASRVDHIVVATGVHRSNDPLVRYLAERRVEVFRGHDDDVLDRFYKAALKHKPDTVVRITGDCPLTDPDIVDRVVEHREITGLDYVANTTLGPPRFPKGLDVEAMAFAALKKAWREAKSPYDREHVTPYIYRSGKFRCGPYKSDRDYSHVRLTVDWISDYFKVKRLVETLGGPGGRFGMKEMLGA